MITCYNTAKPYLRVDCIPDNINASVFSSSESIDSANFHTGAHRMGCMYTMRMITMGRLMRGCRVKVGEYGEALQEDDAGIVHDT
jgi:hypothetical protein